MSREAMKKTLADGPDYERGFVDGMQRQMRLSISKIFGPNLEEILNHAGFYKKREWAGLTNEELHLKAAAYANKRKETYLNYVKKGSAKKLNKETINWLWVAHYEGYRDGMQEQDHGH